MERSQFLNQPHRPSELQLLVKTLHGKTLVVSIKDSQKLKCIGPIIKEHIFHAQGTTMTSNAIINTY